MDDDGHTIKLVRALGICEDLVRGYDDRPWRRIKGDDVWLKLHYTALDSSKLENEKEIRWARGAGFEETWKVSTEKLPLAMFVRCLSSRTKDFQDIPDRK